MISVRGYTEEDWNAICQVHDLARLDEMRGSCDSRALVPLAENPEADDIRRSQKVVACEG
jgi:hypothetical protein